MKTKSGAMIRYAASNKTYVMLGSAFFFLGIIMSSFTHSRVEAAITVPGFVVEPNQTQALIVTFKDAQLEGYGIEKRDGTTAKAMDKLYDGKGYISYFFEEDNSAKGNAAFKVEAPEDGLYELSLGYYIPEGNGDKTTSIQVNGSGAGELTLNAPNPGQVRAEKR
ncbi:hypothetical protein MT997_21640 [Paenibacillus sp. OVF10]|nr:hypothetical protein MT997_21640 [Paenibacillus sp. OVF10]